MRVFISIEYIQTGKKISKITKKLNEEKARKPVKPENSLPKLIQKRNKLRH